MSNQISTQASKVWQLVTDIETTKTYSRAGSLTGSIVKEVGLLLWLVICLTLVLGDWFWKTSVQLGRRTRAGIESFEQPTTDRLASETGKKLITTLRDGATYALTQAREQLGLPQPPPEEPLLSTPKAAIAPSPPLAPAPTPAWEPTSDVASEPAMAPEPALIPEPDLSEVEVPPAEEAADFSDSHDD